MYKSLLMLLFALLSSTSTLSAQSSDFDPIDAINSAFLQAESLPAKRSYWLREELIVTKDRKLNIDYQITKKFRVAEYPSESIAGKSHVRTDGYVSQDNGLSTAEKWEASLLRDSRRTILNGHSFPFSKARLTTIGEKDSFRATFSTHNPVAIGLTHYTHFAAKSLDASFATFSTSKAISILDGKGGQKIAYIVFHDGRAAAEITFEKHTEWMPVSMAFFRPSKTADVAIPNPTKEQILKWWPYAKTLTKWTTVDKNTVPASVYYYVNVFDEEELECLLDFADWKFGEKVDGDLFSEEKFLDTANSVDFEKASRAFDVKHHAQNRR